MMPGMAEDPFAPIMASWKQASETYLSSWTKVLETMAQDPKAEEVSEEAEKTALGAQAAAREMSRQAFEPMVELAGGVPLSEFRRLMDAVHGLHLRLDRIDDQLRELTSEQKKTKRKKA